MGWLGGPLGDYLLRGFAPSEASSLHPGDPHSGLRPADTLAERFGPDFQGAVAARTVIDFGSGTGADAVEIARMGAARVIGVEIRAELRAQAAERAERAGCGDRCIFVERPAEPTDVVISNDAFEHFDDPAGVLRDMAGLIGPDGKVFVAFGPPWLHPRGGHLFSAFPWAHLIFTEACLIRWRARFRKDGARRFAEVPGDWKSVV